MCGHASKCSSCRNASFIGSQPMPTDSSTNAMMLAAAQPYVQALSAETTY